MYENIFSPQLSVLLNFIFTNLRGEKWYLNVQMFKFHDFNYEWHQLSLHMYKRI